MGITIETIYRLRENFPGLGLIEARRALAEADGNFKKAEEIVIEKSGAHIYDEKQIAIHKE